MPATGSDRRRPRVAFRWTVRLRLTVVYSALFLVSGATLLAITYALVVHTSSPSVVTDGGVTVVQGSPGPALNVDPSTMVDYLKAQAAREHAALLRGLLTDSCAALGLMSVASLLFGWVVAGRALRPVRTMADKARRISERNLHERLAMTGPDDELKDLGHSFDALLARLDSAFEAQRRFVANASHELRTPLTTMRAALDVALAKPEPAPPQTVALAGRLRTELDRIERLLEAFLMLARAQHRSMPGQAVLPLDYIVGSALAGQAAAIRAMELTVQDTTSQGGAWVAGSPALLSRMAENVIDNAVCHNAPGGWISVTTGECGGAARLVVENGGQVLDQRQVAELCQPFRRLEADRIGTDQGSGLGLSIVAAIAEAHGGTLDLQARPGGGLRVCVDLPAAAAAESAAGRAGAPA